LTFFRDKYIVTGKITDWQMVVFIVNQSLCRVVLIAELHCIVISLYMNLPVDLIDKFELSNTIGFK